MPRKADPTAQTRCQGRYGTPQGSIPCPNMCQPGSRLCALCGPLNACSVCFGVHVDPDVILYDDCRDSARGIL
jgi:hypothetical protein